MTEREAALNDHTLAVHLPAPPIVCQRPLSPPLYRSTSYAFDSTAENIELRTGQRDGYVYARLDSPTADAFASAAAALEIGGENDTIGGQAFNSGMAAITSVLLAFTGRGGHVVAPIELYGGTYGVLAHLLSRFGVRTDFVDASDLHAVEMVVDSQTDIVYAETLANPTLTVANLPALAQIAHSAGALFIVDSTFTTPILCRPLTHGADLVVHSATKYMGGHSDASGGVVVGHQDLLARVRQVRIDTGAMLAPDEAYLLRRGLYTLPLRMDRHCASALTVAQELAAHPRIMRVDYPGLPSHRDHLLAGKLFAEDRYGGVVTVTVHGGVRCGVALVDGVRMVALATSLGSCTTVAQHVASSTHRQLDDEALAAAGISGGTVRLSIGLENPTDIVADITRALEQIRM